MSTETTKGLATSIPKDTATVTANQLFAPGLTLRGIVVSQREEEKTWEGKVTIWTVMGVSYGEGVMTWKVKHPDHAKGIRAPVPKLLQSITVHVTYCATEKGNVTVQGTMAA